jgi:hypothetical protein
MRKRRSNTPDGEVVTELSPSLLSSQQIRCYPEGSDPCRLINVPGWRVCREARRWVACSIGPDIGCGHGKDSRCIVGNVCVCTVW